MSVWVCKPIFNELGTDMKNACEGAYACKLLTTVKKGWAQTATTILWYSRYLSEAEVAFAGAISHIANPPKHS